MNSDSTSLVPLGDRPTSDQLRAELERISRKRKGNGFFRFLLILVLVLALLVAAVLLLFPAFVVYGNSMAPTLHEGDLVIAATDSSPEIGDLVAFRSGESSSSSALPAAPATALKFRMTAACW